MAFVTFEPWERGFRASVSMEEFLSSKEVPELVLHNAERVYQHSIREMQAEMNDIQAHRNARKVLPARKVWQVGDSVFELVDELAKLSMEIADLYGHLCRDLGTKRKWLEKAIILRRYVPSQNLIPESLPWGRIEKGTRRAAERMASGLPAP